MKFLIILTFMMSVGFLGQDSYAKRDNKDNQTTEETTKMEKNNNDKKNGGRNKTDNDKTTTKSENANADSAPQVQNSGM